MTAMIAGMSCICGVLILFFVVSVAPFRVPAKCALLSCKISKIIRVQPLDNTQTDEYNPREKFLRRIWGITGENNDRSKPLPSSAVPPPTAIGSQNLNALKRNDTSFTTADINSTAHGLDDFTSNPVEGGGVLSWITKPFRRFSVAATDGTPTDNDIAAFTIDDLAYESSLEYGSDGPFRRVRRSVGNVIRNTFRKGDTDRQLPFEQGTSSSDAIFLYADARTNRNMVRKRHMDEQHPQTGGLYASAWRWVRTRLGGAAPETSTTLSEVPSAALRLASPVDEYRVFGTNGQQRKAASTGNIAVASVAWRARKALFDLALWSVGGPNLGQATESSVGGDSIGGEVAEPLRGGSDESAAGLQARTKEVDRANESDEMKAESEPTGGRSSGSARQQTASSFANLLVAGRESATDATLLILRRVRGSPAQADDHTQLSGRSSTKRKIELQAPGTAIAAIDRADAARAVAQAAKCEADARITQQATETSLRLIIMQQVYRIFKQKESKLRETASAEGAIPALPAPGRSDVEVVRAEQSQAEMTSPIEENYASTKDDAGGNPLGWIWDSLPLGKTRSGDEEAPDRVGPTVAEQTAAAESASATTDSPTTNRKASTLASSAVAVRGPHAHADTDIVREPEELAPDDDSASISAERVDELLPSRRDFALIASRRAELAITAALSVNSEFTAKEYLQHIGLKALLAGVVAAPRPEALSSRTSAVRAVSNLVRFHKPLAADLASRSDIVNVLCDMMELPNKRFASLQSQEQKKRQLAAQHEAVALVHRFVRSSEAAVEALRHNVRLRKTLATITQVVGASLKGERARGAATWAANAVAELQSVREGKADVKKNMKSYKVRKQSNVTAVAEYDDLQLHQMAKVASWGLGGVQWKPRVPGQKGLRILSLDGGGTRGVLSIAFLKEILKRVNRNLEPYQMFDLICGTSTGGIIATLLGAQQASLAEAEVLYDAFIDKIFAQRSNLRLVTEQAAYDGRDWEKILYDMCGDQLLLDSNQHDCARVFCVSTKVNVNPPLPNLWRNYNYPPGQRARYPGACRVNTFTAIRATTAAPTFFTPVQWENGLYCDGALVANNPTAIALQEAKMLYPNVPVELVVSIGTGYTTSQSSAQSMGWGALVNQLVASSTDTEDVHELLRDFLPPDKYFRFNPILPDFLRIDEKNKTLLSGLKSLAKKTVDEIEAGPGASNFAQLIKTLRGPK